MQVVDDPVQFELQPLNPKCSSQSPTHNPSLSSHSLLLPSLSHVYLHGNIESLVANGDTCLGSGRVRRRRDWAVVIRNMNGLVGECIGGEEEMMMEPEVGFWAMGLSRRTRFHATAGGIPTTTAGGGAKPILIGGGAVLLPSVRGSPIEGRWRR